MAAPKLIGIRIDIESKSRVNIKYGSYRYAEDPDFGVLCIAYSPMRQHVGGAMSLGKPRLLALNAQRDVAQFRHIITDPIFQKHAYNANFERITLSKWLGMPDGTYIDPENWRCTAVQANVNGVFGTLDDVGRALRSPTAKDKEGKRLIRLFCVPDPKTGQFHEYDCPMFCWCGREHIDDWIRLGEYCCQDVVAEAVVAKMLPAVPNDIQREYEADQRINDRGIRHFAGLSRAAVKAVRVERDRLMDELKQRTGLDNPNSGKQVQEWLVGQGYPMLSLDKDHREEALADPMIPDLVAEVLTLKGAASLSSVAKHQAALDTRCADGRIRGSLRFYGAHTGREAGRGMQPQNMPVYEASAADRVRLIRGQAGQDAPLIAKGTTRASLVPARGHVFVGVDENAIEARTLGWVTGEKWVNAEFDTASGGQGKIYEATAAMMFGLDKAALVQALSICHKCGTCGDCAHRKKGKVSNLALGYNGGAGALVKMGAEDAGIDCGNYADLNAEWKRLGSPGKFWEWERDSHDYPELLRLRDLYREASPQTVRFWKLCAKAWDIASSGKPGARFGQNQVVSLIRDGKHNRIILPSGRSIWYRFARSHYDPNRPDRIDRRTFIGKSATVGHYRVDTHGGSLTENINQAIARDVLFDVIMKIEALTAQGWPGRLILHVHDEVVLEVPEKHADQVLADTLGIMAEPPDWAPGLKVQGAGDIMERYRK